jgi:ferrous iron transport protein B
MTQTTGGAAVAKAPARTRDLVIALVGNPNSGKTTLFNALTGLRQKVGNYPGVTVEKKEGRIPLPVHCHARVLDLPGLYSLTPHSPDELIAREVLMGLRPDTPRPDLIVNVVDATNLERNLYLTSQLLDIGTPVVVALTMIDVAEKAGAPVDAARLAEEIDVPVFPVFAARGVGVPALRSSFVAQPDRDLPERVWKVPAPVAEAIAPIRDILERENSLGERAAFAESLCLLLQDEECLPSLQTPQAARRLATDARDRLTEEGIDFSALAIGARYDWINQVCREVLQREPSTRKRPPSANERIDRVAMHPFWGYVIFLAMMTVLFQSIFSWAQLPMGWIESAVDAAGRFVEAHMAAGDLRDLIKDGVLGGVGSTIIFLPQILILFFFISLLEDTGYLARAAFLMDRLMSKVGLHGKSFIPLLSSFACAIPGIMATRTIGDRKARLITILVAPLMSCSARLPVYALMIAAFVPNRRIASIGPVPILTLPGVTLLSMYLLGIVAAFGIAWLFHRTLLKGVSPTFLLELPPYRAPRLKDAVIETGERAWLFLKRAGTIILALSIVIWFLSTYPKHPQLPQDQQLDHSYVGYLGHAIEPVIQPLGFEWKTGIGIVTSFAAREVFVTTMGIVYNVDDADADGGSIALTQKLREDRDPRTGKPVFTPLVAVCLMVYYVLAMQCLSTVAVVRRETNSWKWPIFQIAYMTGLAWIVTFVVYQGGRLLGFG